MESTEKLHLISCSIDLHNREKYFLSSHLKYANFLRVVNRYEEVVAIAINICNKPHVRGDCTFSAIIIEVFDSCMKLELSLREENVASLRYFAYHLLAYCYIKVGVLAEVCLPVVLHHPDNMPESFFKESTKLFGYQLIFVWKIARSF